jgi:hypothetical protein
LYHPNRTGPSEHEMESARLTEARREVSEFEVVADARTRNQGGCGNRSKKNG